MGRHGVLTKAEARWLKAAARYKAKLEDEVKSILVVARDRYSECENPLAQGTPPALYYAIEHYHETLLAHRWSKACDLASRAKAIARGIESEMRRHAEIIKLIGFDCRNCRLYRQRFVGVDECKLYGRAVSRCGYRRQWAIAAGVLKRPHGPEKLRLYRERLGRERAVLALAEMGRAIA